MFCEYVGVVVCGSSSSRVCDSKSVVTTLYIDPLHTYYLCTLTHTTHTHTERERERERSTGWPYIALWHGSDRGGGL